MLEGSVTFLCLHGVGIWIDPSVVCGADKDSQAALLIFIFLVVVCSQGATVRNVLAVAPIFRGCCCDLSIIVFLAIGSWQFHGVVVVVDVVQQVVPGFLEISVSLLFGDQSSGGVSQW